MAFERITIYDAPSVALGQAAGGLVNPLRAGESSRRLMNAVFTPDQLSPEERKTIVDRLMGEDSGMAGDIMDIATNPLVLGLLFLTPTGYRMAAEGKSLFQVAKKYGWYDGNFGAFKKFLLSPIQAMRGSEGDAIVVQHALRKKALTENVTEGVRVGRNEMLLHLQNIVRQRAGDREARKLKSLLLDDHLHLSRESAARKTLEEFWATLAVRQHGLDKPLSRTVKQGSGKRFRLLNTESGEAFEVSDLLHQEVSNAVDKLVGTRRMSWDAVTRALSKDVKDEFFALSRNQKAEYLRALDEGMSNRYHFMELPGKTDTVEVQEWAENLLGTKSTAKYQELLGVFNDQGALDKLLASEAKARRAAYVHLIGDEAVFAATGELKTDRNKLAMALSAMARRGGEDIDKIDEYTAQVLEGAELIRDRIMGPRWSGELPAFLRDLDMLELSTMNEAKWTKMLDDVENLIKISPEDWASDSFQPRYSKRFQRVFGHEPTPDDTYFMKKDGSFPFSGINRHLWPVTSKEANLDLDELEMISEVLGGDKVMGLSRAGRDLRVKIARRANASESLLRSHTMDVLKTNDEYVRSTLASAALNTTAIDDAVVAADRLVHDAGATMRRGKDLEFLPGWEWLTRQGPRKGLDPLKPLDQLDPVRRQRISIGMAMDRMYIRTPNPEAQRYLRQVVRPAMNEVLDYDEISALSAAHRNKEVARWLANDFLPLQWVKDTKYGKQTIDYLMRIAESPVAYRANLGKDLSGKAAQWFYLTHLGANMASVTLNLMQPLVTVAPHVGLRDLMHGYRTAFTEMGDYVAQRMKMGMFPDAETKLGAMQKSFRHFDEMGIGPDFYQLIDERMSTKTGAFDKFGHLLMSAFEKAEWMNRGVSAHAMEKMYERTGRMATMSPTAIKNDIRQFVLETQFGAQHINTPGVFLKAGSPLSNTLVRQFMSFPLKAFTNAFVTGPQMGGRDWLNGFFQQTLRGLGVSALAYETANAAAGVDISRGLYAQSSTELFGGRSMLESEGGLLGNISPPVIDVPMQVLQGATSGDAAKLMQGLSRLVPGGVALSRGLSVAPGWGAIRKTQQTYAGWNEMQPGGMVPLYNSQGALIEMRHWSELAARGLGLDLGAWKNQGELDNYLIKQRDAMSQMKNDYMRRLRANDIAGASRVRSEWNRKFKDPNGKPMPLTVTKASLQRYLDNQVRGRTERVLDRLPPEVRGRYAALVEEAGYARNVPVTSGATARSRDPFRQAPAQLPVEEMISRDAQAQ